MSNKCSVFFLFSSNGHDVHKHFSTEESIEMGGNLVCQIKFFSLQSCAEKSLLLVEKKVEKIL